MESKQKNILIAVVIIGILFWFLIPMLKLLSLTIFRIGIPILWLAALISF